MNSNATRVVLRRSTARKLNPWCMEQEINKYTRRVETKGRLKTGWEVLSLEKDSVHDEKTETTQKDTLRHHYTASFIVRNNPRRARKSETVQRELDAIKDMLIIHGNCSKWELSFDDVEISEVVNVVKLLKSLPVVKGITLPKTPRRTPAAGKKSVVEEPKVTVEETVAV